MVVIVYSNSNKKACAPKAIFLVTSLGWAIFVMGSRFNSSSRSGTVGGLIAYATGVHIEVAKKIQVRGGHQACVVRHRRILYAPLSMMKHL